MNFESLNNMEFSSRQLDVLEAALPIFAARGFYGTSMADIADAVGVRKATLYSHFDSKETIFRNLIDAVIAEQLDFVRKFFESSKGDLPLLQLEKYFRGYIKHCWKNPKVDFWIKYYYFPPVELKKEILSKTHKYENIISEKLAEIVECGIKSGHIIKRNSWEITVTYYSLLIGLVMSLDYYTDKGLEKDVSACISVFLNGIKV